MADVPSLFDVEIGTKYPVKSPVRDDSMSNDDRPTIQFLAPNSGITKELFPEYEVVITKSTNEISIISARHIFENIAECDYGKQIAIDWISMQFTNLNYSVLRPNYSSPSANIYINVGCSYTDSDPFPTLEYQVRGRKQDEDLKNAWEQFFANQR